MSNLAPSSRETHLDGLRGLAASAVVLCHFVSAFLPHGAFGSAYTAHYVWEGLLFKTPLGILTAGHFAVCLFFLMSGYVLAAPLLARKAPLADVVAAIVKRPFRLGGVVLGTMLISWVIWHFHGYRNHEVLALSGSKWFDYYWPGDAPTLPQFFKDSLRGFSDSASQLGQHLGSLDRRSFLKVLNSTLDAPFNTATLFNQPMWTIGRELWGSWLVFGLLLLRPAPVRWFFIAAFTLWYARNLMQCFLIGMILAEIHQVLMARGRRWVMPGWLALGLSVVAIVCGSFPKYVSDVSAADLSQTLFAWTPRLPWLGGNWSMLGALCLMLVVLYHPAPQRFLNRAWVQFLGHVSYALYGVHFLILGSLASWTYLAAVPALGRGTGTVLTLVALLAGTLVGAVIIDRCVDRPALALAQNIGRRTKTFCSRFF